jgi:hypothetical protein
LVSAASILVTGRDAALSTWDDDEVEMKKFATAAALGGDVLIVFDNVDTRLGGATLNKLLTKPHHEGRVLGYSLNYKGPLYAVWVATGINMTYRSETRRRTLPCRLESPEERPEQRGGFKYPNLLRHIERHRPEYLADVLTILLAYCAAGKPTQPLTPYGSFHEWSDLVRSALVWVGLPDPVLTREGIHTAIDPELEGVPVLFNAMQLLDENGAGLTAAQILSAVETYAGVSSPKGEMFDELKATLELICAPPEGRDEAQAGNGVSTKSLGKKLSFLCDRPIDGRVLRFIPSKGHHAARYRAEKLKKGPRVVKRSAE